MCHLRRFTAQRPCSVRKRFNIDHVGRPRLKPGSQIVGSEMRFLLATETAADCHSFLHWDAMSAGDRYHIRGDRSNRPTQNVLVCFCQNVNVSQNVPPTKTFHVHQNVPCGHGHSNRPLSRRIPPPPPAGILPRRRRRKKFGAPPRQPKFTEAAAAAIFVAHCGASDSN